MLGGYQLFRLLIENDVDQFHPSGLKAACYSAA